MTDNADFSFIYSLPLDTKVLFLNNLSLKSIPCLLRFHSLEELHIENNELVYLPPFPCTLKRIYCFNNKLKALPPLPEGLEILDCSKNRLRSLPAFEMGLKLICHDNNFFIYFVK